MATNYNYPDPANIEEAAKYRPGVASNIFNVLTGGLAGQITGSTQKAQEAARARQALLQEEFSKRDEERAIQRQLMLLKMGYKAEAAKEGLPIPEGATPEEILAINMQNRKLRAIGKQTAYDVASGNTPQGLGLLLTDSRENPAFQAGLTEGKTDVAQNRAQLKLRQDIEDANIAGEYFGLTGTQLPAGISPAEARGRYNAARYVNAYKIPAQIKQEDEKIAVIDLFNQYPGLKTFGGMSDANIQELPPQAARGLLTRANKELETSKTLQNKEAQASAFTRTMGILNLPFEQRTTPENLQTLYADASLVGKSITDSPKWQATMGLGPKLDNDQLKEVKSYSDSLSIGNRFAKLVAAAASQPGGLKKFQDNNFGTIRNALNTQGSKFFSNDAERELARALVQEYEAFVQGPRKFLFGASLTKGEQGSANLSFGTASDKDFFNRAIQFIDRVHENDPVTFYLDAGKSINDPVVSGVINKKKEYNNYKQIFAPSPLSPAEEARKQELLKKTRKAQ